MKNFLAAAVTLASTFAISSGALASPTVINFDNLGSLVLVTNQYAGVTFSSDNGDGVYTFAPIPPYIISRPNFICTGNPSEAHGIDCAQDVFVAFAGPVNSLSFAMTGDDAAAQSLVGVVDAFNGASLLGSVNIIGDGNNFDSQLIDLGSFLNVTSIKIHTVTDPGGLAYDDFTFNSGSPVPEPLTLSLFGAGLAGAVAMRRRRKKAA